MALGSWGVLDGSSHRELNRTDFRLLREALGGGWLAFKGQSPATPLVIRKYNPVLALIGPQISIAQLHRTT